MISIPLNFLSLSMITLLAICIGSFLNVVILRLPKILVQKYQQQAQEILNFDTAQEKTRGRKTKENINRKSQCPKCHTILKAWHNIPIISFLFLRGKCAFCHHNISVIYPIIELVSGLITLLIVSHFGITVYSLLLCVLCFFLLVLTIIDLQCFLLPDCLTLPLIWIGLLINSMNIFTTPALSILGAILGYVILWLFFWLFKLATKKEGMGYGDFKLTAALGAWFGAKSLLFIIIFSAIFGIIFAVFLKWLQHNHTKQNIIHNSPFIPFGPAISLIGFLYPFVGISMTQWYFSLLHIG